MFRALPIVSLILLIGWHWCAAYAQAPRGEWKDMDQSFDVEAHLTHSLANAELSAQERGDIYRLIDDKTVHDSFTDNQREDERQAVLSARVGFIRLADRGPSFLLVQGPRLFCGATGNCSLWIFARAHGQLRLVLTTGGGILILSKHSTRGFHDIATGWHMSAEEEGFSVYRWDGTQYAPADCYWAHFNSDDPSLPPSIKNCPGWRQ
jgi:hypothetical protein